MNDTSTEEAQKGLTQPASTITAKAAKKRSRRGVRKGLRHVAPILPPLLVTSGQERPVPAKGQSILTAADITEQGRKSIVAIQQQLATALTPQSLRQMVMDEMQKRGMNPIAEIVSVLQTLDGMERLNGLEKVFKLVGATSDQLESSQQSRALTQEISRGGSKLVINIQQFGSSSPVILRDTRRGSSTIDVSGTSEVTLTPSTSSSPDSGESPSGDGSATLDGMTSLTPQPEPDYSEFLRGTPPTPSGKVSTVGERGQ